MQGNAKMVKNKAGAFTNEPANETNSTSNSKGRRILPSRNRPNFKEQGELEKELLMKNR